MEFVIPLDISELFEYFLNYAVQFLFFIFFSIYIFIFYVFPINAEKSRKLCTNSAKYCVRVKKKHCAVMRNGKCDDI